MDIETIPLDSAPEAGLASDSDKNPDKIKIYRSSSDPGFEFHETGMLVMNGENPDYDYIVEEFRKEAARRGGDAVIKFRIKIRRKGEWVEKDDDDNSGSSSEYEVKTFYTASGTLIVKAEEER